MEETQNKGWRLVDHYIKDYSFNLLSRQAPLDNVNLRILISDIKEIGENLEIEYVVTVNYGKIGRLDLRGYLTVNHNNKEEILKKWREEASVEDELGVEWINTIYFLTNNLVSGLSAIMGFPSPIIGFLPKNTEKQKQTE